MSAVGVFLLGAFGRVNLIILQVSCACPVTLTCCHLWGPIPDLWQNSLVTQNVLWLCCMPASICLPFSLHVIQSRLTFSSPGERKHLEINCIFTFPAESFFAWRRGSGTEEPFCGDWSSLPEGSAGWMLLNTPVFLLKPLSVSIVPQPFPSSDSSSMSVV